MGLLFVFNLYYTYTIIMFCIHVQALLYANCMTCKKKTVAVAFEFVVLSIIYYVLWNGDPRRRPGQIASRLIERRRTDINIIIISYIRRHIMTAHCAKSKTFWDRERRSSAYLWPPKKLRRPPCIHTHITHYNRYARRFKVTWTTRFRIL